MGVYLTCLKGTKETNGNEEVGTLEGEVKEIAWLIVKDLDFYLEPNGIQGQNLTYFQRTLLSAVWSRGEIGGTFTKILY